MIVFFKDALFFTETKAAFPQEAVGTARTERELLSLIHKNGENPTVVVVRETTFSALKNKKKLLEDIRVYFLVLIDSEEDVELLDALAAHQRSDYLKKPYAFAEFKTKIRKQRYIIDLDNNVHVLHKEIQAKEALLEDRFFVDYLTGSYNYHYLVSKLSFCIKKLREEMLPLTLVMLDIDGFQRIVDAHGYAFGEDVIRQLSASIMHLIRTSDILIRSGGEEFILLLPHTVQKQGIFVARRLKAHLEQEEFGNEKKKIHVPVSMGVSFSTKQHPHAVKALLKQAQKAMKFSKSRGGSAVSVYESKMQLDAKNAVDESLKKLRGKVYHLQERAQQDLVEMVYGFARTIEANDNYTGKHVENTLHIAEKVAGELKLTPVKRMNIKHAAILHDLGKVAVDQGILLKKGKLTDEEMKAMQKHPLIAAEILKYIKALRGALPAIKHHHEWYNGKGYPFGLKGEEIPIEARVVAIADVYQALTSDRPYRKAFKKEDALAIIVKEKGTHFDPKVVDAFMRAINE